LRKSEKLRKEKEEREERDRERNGELSYLFFVTVFFTRSLRKRKENGARV
jgi:hypothetical protein